MQLRQGRIAMKPGQGNRRDKANGDTGERWNAAWAHRRIADQAQDKGDRYMVVEGRSGSTGPAAAHPLSELLACPTDTGSVLTASAQTIAFDAGQVIFRQSGACEGLYLVVQGQLLRRTERQETRFTLGMARPGDLVELAAALGDRQHTYSLVAQSPGALLLLPIDALHRAFESYPQLRMHLLEELAREVSRAYTLCSQSWWGRSRRGAARTPAA